MRLDFTHENANRGHNLSVVNASTSSLVASLTPVNIMQGSGLTIQAQTWSANHNPITAKVASVMNSMA